MKAKHFFHILILLALSTTLVTTSVSAQYDHVNSLIIEVNELRRAYDLPAYAIDFALMYAAQMQADWCARNNLNGHEGPGGNLPQDRAQSAGYGYGYASDVAESISVLTADIHTPSLVVRMWRGSWESLSAMVSTEYEDIGVGYAEGAGNSWYVMLVGLVDETSPLFEPGRLDAEGGVIPFTVSTPNASGTVLHEVETGQTTWTIAAYYGVELQQLYLLNDINADSILHTGDVLVIEAGESATPTPEPLMDEKTVAESYAAQPMEVQIPVTASKRDSGNRIFNILIVSGFALGLVLLILCIVYNARNRGW